MIVPAGNTPVKQAAPQKLVAQAAKNGRTKGKEDLTHTITVDGQEHELYNINPTPSKKGFKGVIIIDSDPPINRLSKAVCNDHPMTSLNSPRGNDFKVALTKAGYTVGCSTVIRDTDGELKLAAEITIPETNLKTGKKHEVYAELLNKAEEAPTEAEAEPKKGPGTVQ